MHTFLIFIWIWLAFTSISFWESSIEGRNPWAKKQAGWKIKLSKNISLTRYHFFLFVITIPMFLLFPLVIFGWNLKLFGILISAYFSGLVIEDFLWFIVNPVVKFSEWKTSFTDYYPWIKINNKKIIPVYYIVNLGIAVLSWLFIWR